MLVFELISAMGEDVRQTTITIREPTRENKESQEPLSFHYSNLVLYGGSFNGIKD